MEPGRSKAAIRALRRAGPISLLLLLASSFVPWHACVRASSWRKRRGMPCPSPDASSAAGRTRMERKCSDVEHMNSARGRASSHKPFTHAFKLLARQPFGRARSTMQLAVERCSCNLRVAGLHDGPARLRRTRRGHPSCRSVDGRGKKLRVEARVSFNLARASLRKLTPLLSGMLGKERCVVVSCQKESWGGLMSVATRSAPRSHSESLGTPPSFTIETPGRQHARKTGHWARCRVYQIGMYCTYPGLRTLRVCKGTCTNLRLAGW